MVEYSISLLNFDKPFFSSHLKVKTISYSLMIQKKNTFIKDNSSLAGFKTIRLIEDLRLEIAKLLLGFYREVEFDEKFKVILEELS